MRPADRGKGSTRHLHRDATEHWRGEHAHRQIGARAGDRTRRLADEHDTSDPRRAVEREPQREQPAERAAHQRDLVDAQAVEHPGDDVDGLLPDRSALPEVRRRQAVTRKIDEQMAVSGQTPRERRHPDPRRGDAVDEQHRIAYARLQDTDPHRRRRDVDPAFLDLELVRGRDTPLDRPEPRLDPHRRGTYAGRELAVNAAHRARPDQRCGVLRAGRAAVELGTSQKCR